MTKVNYHLTDHQIAALKKLSKQEGLSVAELIRRAIDLFLAAQKAESSKR